MSVYGRRLFIGDIHGCSDELARLLKDFAPRRGVDRIVSIGDVVGKGPDALGCLRLLREAGAEVLCGNHDAFLLQGAALPREARTRGQQQYLESLGAAPLPWLEWMQTWPLWIEATDLFAVHAGFTPGLAHPRDMPREWLLHLRTWNRREQKPGGKEDPPWFECGTWAKPVIFGHWAAKGLIDRPAFKGLDTGCVYGRRLTGYCPEEKAFLHIEAAQVYQAVKAG